MPVTRDHLLAVYNPNGSSYGAEMPAVSEVAATIAGEVKPAFVAGDGGTVTQQTSKATGVTLNKKCGRITTTNSALAAGAEVTFTVTNSECGPNDIVVVNHVSGGTAGAYLPVISAVGNGSFSITISNASTGSLSQAIVLGFAIIKGVNS
jgi:hypothetical protein